MEAISMNFYEAFLIGLHFESFMVFFLKYTIELAVGICLWGYQLDIL